MRLIDADALKEKAYSVTVKNEWHMHESIDVVDVEDVDNMPTIDAVPVRHGKWLQPEDGCEDYGSISCSCSVCGWTFNYYEDDVNGAPYCPMCGANMEPVAPWYQREETADGGRQ